MQGIEFDEERNVGGFTMKTTPVRPEGKPSYALKVLESLGIEDKTTANIVLLGVAVVFIGITFFLYAGALGESVPSKQSVEQISAQLKVMREMQTATQ